MVENSSGKEKKSKLTSLKIRQAKNFQPSDKFTFKKVANIIKGCVSKFIFDTQPLHVVKSFIMNVVFNVQKKAIIIFLLSFSYFQTGEFILMSEEYQLFGVHK